MSEEIKDKDLEKAAGGGVLDNLLRNQERMFKADGCANFESTAPDKHATCNICAHLLDGSCTDHP